MFHAVKHHLCVLETFTVTVLEGKDPQRKSWPKREEGILQGCCSGLWGLCFCAQVYTNIPSSVQLCVTDLVVLNSGSESSVSVPAATWCGWLRVTALLLHPVNHHGAQQSLDWTSPVHFAQFIWFYTNAN